jgi:hypothetical protein
MRSSLLSYHSTHLLNITITMHRTLHMILSQTLSHHFHYRCTSIHFPPHTEPPQPCRKMTTSWKTFKICDTPKSTDCHATLDSLEMMPRMFRPPGYLIRACAFRCLLRFPIAPLHASGTPFERFNELLRCSRRILALLGPGLSASSGLETFRPTARKWRNHNASLFLMDWYWQGAPMRMM